MKNVLFLYEKLAYYSSISIGEYNKIASFIRDPLILLAALGARGIKPTKWQVAIFITLGIIISVAGGIVLINLGVPQYQNTIGNQNNPQMQQLINQQQQILLKFK